jgi:hypothetical protein
MNVQVNYLAVLLAAISSMGVGALWYAKPMLGKTWMKLVKLDDKKMQKGATAALTFTFMASLVTAYVLAHVTYLSNQFFGNSFLQDALTTAFWLWLGLTAARMVTHDLFEQRSPGLTFMNIVHELITLEVMALVIGLLKV